MSVIGKIFKSELTSTLPRRVHQLSRKDIGEDRSNSAKWAKRLPYQLMVEKPLGHKPKSLRPRGSSAMGRVEPRPLAE